MKVIKALRCAAIVQPGEYLIARWDNKQCEERHLHHLAKCEICGNHYCLTMHWGKHAHE